MHIYLGEIFCLLARYLFIYLFIKTKITKFEAHDANKNDVGGP